MYRNKTILIGFVLGCIYVFLKYCSSVQPEGEAKELSLDEHRIQKDQSFREWNSSPLPKKEIGSFTGLNYFPENKVFKVEAEFKRVSGEKPFAFPATNDTSYLYVKYGELSFTVNGVACKLSVYQSPDIVSQKGKEDYLFIPFTDLTNGKETYGGGRYLDFRIPESEKVYLDFNYAYNPYCVYDPTGYYCPIPPKENQLPIRIEAGEKNFGNH
jgi:uncharacterized protein (DUF1684 family)